MKPNQSGIHHYVKIPIPWHYLNRMLHSSITLYYCLCVFNFIHYKIYWRKMARKNDLLQRVSLLRFKIGTQQLHCEIHISWPTSFTPYPCLVKVIEVCFMNDSWFDFIVRILLLILDCHSCLPFMIWTLSHIANWHVTIIYRSMGHQVFTYTC